MMPFAGRHGRRLRSLLWRPALDDEVADELAFHLEMRAREYAARGLPPAAAAAAARRRFGDLEQVRTTCRAIARGRERLERRHRWLAETAHDLRLAARRLAAAPAVTVVAVLALAAGLAAVDAAWQVARATRPALPFAAADDLVWLRVAGPQAADLAVAPAAFALWRRHNHSFLDLAAYEVADVNLGAPHGALAANLAAAPRLVRALRVTASLLPLLGGRPWLGRGFTVQEAALRGDHAVALLSHSLWVSRFAGDPAAVGSEVEMDGQDVRVVGVLPPGWESPAGAEIWLPIQPRRLQAGDPRRHHRLAVVGRLRPGATPARAAADLAAAAGPADPDGGAWEGVRVTRLAEAGDGGRWQPRARLLLAAAGLLWLLGSVSAANVIWAGASARQREIDLSAALGGRGRVVRQLLAEGLLVAAIGAAAGLLAAGATAPWLARAAGDMAPVLAGTSPALAQAPAAGWQDAVPARLAAAAAMGIDGRGAALLTALAVVAGLLCGVGPVAQALRPGLGETIRQSARLTTRRERRLRDGLVIAELACAVTLVAVAGRLCDSYLRLSHGDPGFAVDHVVTLDLALNGPRYPPAVRRALLARLEERVQGLPGVAAAGAISTAPLAAGRLDEPFILARHPRDPLPPPAPPWSPTPAAPPAAPGAASAGLAVEWRVVTPGIFPALGVQLLSGRLLAAGDRERQPLPVVVDRTVVARWWPQLEPLGRRLLWPALGREMEVVGVVAAWRDTDLEAAPRPAVFLPYGAVPWRSMTLVVRPAPGVAPDRLAAAARGAAAAVDPALPLPAGRLLEAARVRAAAGPRFGLWLVAIYAAAALALATSGVYATVAASVVRRTAEIAVRQALGAARAEVRRLVFRHGARLACGGLALGAAGAWLFADLLRGLLYEPAAVPAAGGGSLCAVAIYAAAAALLGATAALAAVLPARRAAAIQPVIALRRD